MIGLATAIGLGHASTALPQRVEHVCFSLDRNRIGRAPLGQT